MGGIFGGGDSEQKVTQIRDIPPATPEEQGLLANLIDLSQNKYWQPSQQFIDVLNKSYKPSEETLNVLSNYYKPSDDFLSGLQSAVSTIAGVSTYAPSSYFMSLLDKYYKPSQGFLNVLAKHYQPSQEFVETMKNPYIAMLPYQEAWGDYLNQAVQSGVVNSTITQNAMAKLGQALAERGRELRFQGLQLLEEAQKQALADELQRAVLGEEAQKTSLEDQWRRAVTREQLEEVAAQQRLQKAIQEAQMRAQAAIEEERARMASLQDQLNRAITGEELTQQSLADELKRASMLEDARRTSIEDQYRQMFNIWQTLYSGRMGVPVSTTTTTTGPGLFSQVAGTALGLGLGYWLGPGGGLSTIGSWGSGLLGGLFGAGAAGAAASTVPAAITLSDIVGPAMGASVIAL